MFTDWNVWADSESMFKDMMKKQADMYGKMTEAWGGSTERKKEWGQGPGDFFNMHREMFGDSGANALKSMMFFMPAAGMGEDFFKANMASPEKTTDMFRALFEEFSGSKDLWEEQSDRIREFARACNINGFEPNAFNSISRIYEKEFRKILNVPKLGLTRLYQERMTESVEKFSKFNTQMAEFMMVLGKPVDDSFKDLREELQDLAKKGKLPEDMDQYFKKWTALLEEQYASLFKSSDYNKILAQTLESMGDFVKTRDELIQDVLKTMPVPTQNDMDDLYKDLYVMKKKIRDIEKKIKSEKKKHAAEENEGV